MSACLSTGGLPDARIREIGRSSPSGGGVPGFHLPAMDGSVAQQCIHCGLCLPTCPTYDATKLERNSPRGRIALMRGIAEGSLEVTRAFGEELYFCLGCLACETACPAGVRYSALFENARADIERAGVLRNWKRDLARVVSLRGLFAHPRLLRALGRLIWFYQATGLQNAARKLGLVYLLPAAARRLEPLTPRIARRFSDELIGGVERPAAARYRVGMLTGCAQDLVFSGVNRDTVSVLVENGCEVVTPRGQFCCGSLHAHNGDVDTAREMARRNIDMFDVGSLDAIVSNAAGCGTQLKQYGHLLAGDDRYAARAKEWSSKLYHVHEWLCKIGIKAPAGAVAGRVAYHEACHLCHGQKISKQPREILAMIPGLQVVELREATWCCGSAGIYNITQPEMSAQLLKRKLSNIAETGADIVATSNPGCMIQLEAGLRAANSPVKVAHTMSLLARAYGRGG